MSDLRLRTSFILPDDVGNGTFPRRPTGALSRAAKTAKGDAGATLTAHRVVVEQRRDSRSALEPISFCERLPGSAPTADVASADGGVSTPVTRRYEVRR